MGAAEHGLAKDKHEHRQYETQQPAGRRLCPLGLEAPAGQPRQQGKETHRAEHTHLVSEESHRVFRVEEVAAEVGIVDRMAHGLEIIGGVPGKVRRHQQPRHQQRQRPAFRHHRPPHRRVHKARQHQSDEEVEHRILGEDAEPERRAQRCRRHQPAAAAQPPGEIKPRAPERHENAVRRQDAGRQRHRRHQRIEERRIDSCFR